jgi:hypothetical protein
MYDATFNPTRFLDLGKGQQYTQATGAGADTSMAYGGHPFPTSAFAAPRHTGTTQQTTTRGDDFGIDRNVDKLMVPMASDCGFWRTSVGILPVDIDLVLPQTRRKLAEKRKLIFGEIEHPSDATVADILVETRGDGYIDDETLRAYKSTYDQWISDHPDGTMRGRPAWTEAYVRRPR